MASGSKEAVIREMTIEGKSEAMQCDDTFSEGAWHLGPFGPVSVGREETRAGNDRWK